MTNPEFDALLEEEVAELAYVDQLETKVYDLEKKIIELNSTIADFNMLREKWDKILDLAGLGTSINIHTFEYERQESMLTEYTIPTTAAELGRLAKLGLDFDYIRKGIEQNDILKAQWKQMLMTMKLSQEDPGDDRAA